MSAPRRALWRPRACRRHAAVAALAATLGLFVAACGGSSDPSTSPTSTGAARRAVGTTATTSTTATTIGPRDGSLGDESSSRACTLLDASEIEAQFGGPVDAPTPIYPYCQWVVGDDRSAFVAVTIIPMPIEEARRIHTVRSEVGGVGDDAYIASTRAIIFGNDGVSHSILWQKVGDFTTVETERLSALARNLLARL